MYNNKNVKIMKKNLFLAALAFVAVASCTSDEFVGENTSPTTSKNNGTISFGMSTPSVTRATTGSAAATLLNENFVVFGYKTVSSTPSIVFDNYQANWVTNTAGTTESNSADWEYVGYKNLPYGTTTTSGGTLNSNGVASNASGSSTNVEQSIKYWDFNASQYDFYAYSLGAGYTTTGETPTTTYAKATAISNTTNTTYQLSGTASELGACYISKKTSITPSSSSAKEVDLVFMSFLSKIQLKFYETIPGYSVKDVKFYPSASGTSGTTPYLYGSEAVLPSGGTYTITFDNAGDPIITFASSGEDATKAANVAFSSTLTNYATLEYKEASGDYLGRASNDATSTDQITVLPNSTGAALTLKMDYTLVSRDNSGETINVTGATATIPADYTKWKSNYAYTYIFKISDNTDGSIGGMVGLYPITLDAEVITDEAGSQTTITTVATPSITTYAKEALVNNEYLAGNIYVVVNDGVTLTVGTNAKLYTATLTGSTPAAQGITEETVANALTKTADGSGNYVVTDALGGVLTVTPVASNLTAVTSIPAEDAPGGKEMNITGAKFAATAGTTYVFEYIYTESATVKKAYKVIKVASGS